MKNHFLRIGLTVISSIIVLSVGFLPGKGLIPASAATDPIWTFVGCDGPNSINYDSNKGAQYPAITPFMNELYAIWEEDTKIRVKLYRGSGWIQAGTPDPLNRGTGAAQNASLMVYKENLYAAWNEYTSATGGTYQIHVSKFNGTTWTAADGLNGCINHGITAHAYRPSLAVYGENLYAAWSEQANSGINQIRVSKYDVSSGWTPVDKNGDYGINYDTSCLADYPVLAVYNNKLYAVWQEQHVSSGKFQVILKSYDGNSTGTWDLVDAGLNCSNTNDGTNPTIIEYNGALYCAWEEKTKTYLQIHVKKYDGSNWTYVKNDETNGWNYNIDLPAAAPVFCVFNRSLYVSWGETAKVSTGTGTVNKKQIRIAKYDNDTDTKIFFDGNISTGLNKDNTQSAENPGLAILNGDLCVAWQEPNATGFGQFLVKKTPLPAITTSLTIPVGTYSTTNPFNITVNFSKSVTVTGTPYIPITLDTGGTINAAYVSGSGTNALVFRYTVASGHLDTDGIQFDTNPAIILGSGGAIKDQTANQDADLNLNGLPSDISGVLVDGVTPTVTISTPSNPTSNSPIPVSITFSEAVTDFTENDITVGNGTLSNFNGSGTTYTIDITPFGSTVTVNVATGAAHDAAGNGNTAANQLNLAYNGMATMTISPGNNPVLTESNLDGGNITVTLTGTTFVNNRQPNFTLANSPTGLTITGITNINTARNQCVINLAFNSSMTTNINNFHITIDGSEINNGGSGLTSNDLTIVDDLNSNKHYINPGGSGGGNGSYLRNFLTAGNFRGDLTTTWNHDELILGKGASGVNSDLWFYYPGLTGPGGLISTGTSIDRAELVFKVKSINSDKFIPRRIKIYTIPDSGLERPYFGSTDGLRSGLNFLYRDNRLGRKVLWKNETANILAAVTATELNDTFEYLPYAFEENGEMFIKVDVTNALRLWADNPAKNHGWYIMSEGESNAGDNILIYGTTAANTGDRPYLRVIYADNGADLTPPAKVSINISLLRMQNQQITLNWTNPSSDVAGIRIVRKYGLTPSGPEDGSVIVDRTALAGATESFVDNNGLVNGRTYYYAFFAYDSFRNYSSKSYIALRPEAWPSTLAAPTSFNATAASTSINLTWVFEPSNKASNFEVMRSDDGGTNWNRVAMLPVNQTAYQDKGLQPNTSRQYRLRAVNPYTLDSQGNPANYSTWVYSNPNPVHTLIGPVAPSNLSWSVISSSEVQLRWDEVAGQTYRIEILNETGVLLRSEAAVDLKTSDLAVFQCSVMRLTANVGYRFRVVAINGAGENAAETEVIKTAVDFKPIFF